MNEGRDARVREEPGAPQDPDHYILRHLAGGIVRRGDEILMVEQQGPGDERSSSVIPGGRVEPGELLHEALAREVAEETGLEVLEVGQPVYLVQCDAVPEKMQVLVHIFEIAQWRGEVGPRDPDGFILQAQWMEAEAAIEVVAELPWIHMRQPLTAYLRGEAAAGTVWLYRRDERGNERLVWRRA